MKYIISSGTSVVSKIIEEESFYTAITDNSSSAKSYDTFGDAMKDCIKINNLIGSSLFKVMTINQ